MMLKHEFFKKSSLHQTLAITCLILGLGASTANAANDVTTTSESHSDGVVKTVTDSAITTLVKASLINDSAFGKSNISVTTINGVVTLKGTTSSADAKALASDHARKVDGVKGVHNKLKLAESSSMATKTNDAVVKTERVVSDSWITTKVKSEVYADSVSKGFKVGVKTLHGVVILSGKLPNQDGIDHVKEIASKVKGVKDVDTTALTIASQ